MPVFELIPSENDSAIKEDFSHSTVSTPVLLSNACWFVQIRWIVIFLFFITALSSHVFVAPLASIGFEVPFKWMFVLGLVLLPANIIYSFLLRYLHEDSPRNYVLVHIWLQIVVDLIFISAMI